MAVLYIMNVAKLNDPDVYQKYTVLLPEWKKQELDRFRYKEDKARGAGGYLLLCRAWEETGHHGIFHISSREYGKPFIVEDAAFNYNISHSGDYAVLLTAKDEAGVDIEKIRTTSQTVAERFFSETENNRIQAAENKTLEFFTIWTIRESYIKARGTGLTDDFRSFSVGWDNEKAFVQQNDVIMDYSIITIKILPGYIISICIKGRREGVELIEEKLETTKI